MKTILVDAVSRLIVKENGTYKTFEEMYLLLDKFAEPKVILSNANDEEYKKFGLQDAPYPVFTLKHHPDKTDPNYFLSFLESQSLRAKDVIYFEHNSEAVKSAQSIDITALYYNDEKKDLEEVKKFLTKNI